MNSSDERSRRERKLAKIIGGSRGGVYQGCKPPTRVKIVSFLAELL